MEKRVFERVLETAKFMVETKKTVRETARQFGVSKTTVHIDMVERLPRVSKELFKQVRTVLDVNKQERHTRGGEGNKQKHRQRKAK